jgi:hypothetical protein
MADTNSRQPPRELLARFSLPLIGDTLAFVRDPAGFLQKRALGMALLSVRLRRVG